MSRHRRSWARTAIYIVAAATMLPAYTMAQYNRYGVHEAKSLALPPSCADAGVFCMTDSTRRLFDQCCMRASEASWLIVASAGDSLEVYAQGEPNAFLTLVWPEHKSWQEHYGGATAGFVRLRLPETTVYSLEVGLDLSADSRDNEHSIGLPYDLIVRRIGAPLTVREAPLLRLIGKARYEVRAHAAAAKASTITAGSYRVLSTEFDSLEVCRLPCRRRQLNSVRTNRPVTAGSP